MLRHFSRTVALLLVILMMLSCTQKTVRLSKPTPPKPSPPSSVTSEDRKKISSLLTREQYADALNMMKRKISAGAEEQNFSTLYVTAVNGLITMGDEQLKKNDQAKAGVSFRQALDNYPSNELMQRKVSRSAQNIEGALERLSIDMMDAALLKYRSGELEEAIAIWDDILAFDPNNGEVQKARNTAQTQLENLRKME